MATENMAEINLRARWVFPVAGPPLEGGTVRVEGERLAAVDMAGVRTADLDLGNVAVLPGLVNAHTHLDLTGLRGLAPPSPDFVGWLRRVIAHRRAQSPEQVRRDVEAGLAECVRTGTTLLGDISGDGTSWAVLADGPVRAVVFRELLGLPEHRALEAWRTTLAWLEYRGDTACCRVGLSPHAPYSVRDTLFRAVSRHAREHGVPVAVHLAETGDELELLAKRRGPFVEFLEDLDVWDPDGLVKSPAGVARLFSGPVPVLFVHGNYLKPGTRIAPSATVVYCPRTHAAFGHPPHPFRAFLDRGVRVALGTDALASNPDLDLLAEARFLAHRHPDLPGDVLLRMATLAGAEALGWADETGSLEPGKSADLVVLPLPDAEAADPHALVFDSDLPVGAVMSRGRWLK